MGSIVSRPSDAATPHPDDAIGRIIDELMSEGNLTVLPDSIERKIYRRLLTKALTDVKILVENTRIQTLGHEVTLVMRPL